MSRNLYLVKLTEAVVPEEGTSLDDYYDSRAGAVVGTLQTNVRYVRDQIGLLAEALNLLYTDLDIIAYAVGDAGNDIFEVIKGIGQSATGVYAVTVEEISE